MAKDSNVSLAKKKKRTKLKAVIAMFVALGMAERIDYGIPRIIDGDTIELEDKKIRFYGIDALEQSQTCIDQKKQTWQCGKESTKHLQEIINNKNILCVRVHKKENHKDKYRRFVSICYNGNLESINAEMVESGFAVAAVKYSHLYLTEEASAQANKKGIWSSKFKRPDEYRKSRRSNIP